MTSGTNLPISATRTETILKILRIICWAAFFVMMMKGVSLLLSFITSNQEPEKAKNLLPDLNLFALREYSFGHYALVVSYLLGLFLMKAGIAFMLARALGNMSGQSPFTTKMAGILSTISYILLVMALLSLLHNIHTNWIDRTTNIVIERAALADYLFTAGLVFVIAQLYKRGVEIQSENELTV